VVGAVPLMPQTLAGRLVPAVAIALFVSLGIGAALAAGDGETGAAEVTAIHIPEARIGDRASYDLTLEGEWLYDDKVAGQPFPFLTFDWRAGTPILDDQGRLRPTDVVRIEGLAYSPHNVEFTDGAIVQGPAWLPENETAWFDPGTTSLLATGGRDRMNDTAPATNLPVPAGLASRTYDLNATYINYWTQGSGICLAGESWQGTTVHVDAPLEAGACSLGHLSHHRMTWEPLVPMGKDTIAGIDAYRFEGFNAYDGTVTVWLAAGIPFPVRYQATQENRLGWDGSDEGTGTFTLDLTGYSPGSQDRVPLEPPGPLPPPLATAPRQPWGLDETGIDHPFAASAAFRIATEQSTAVKAILATSPGAYVADTWFVDFSDPNDAHRIWYLTVTDGSTHAMVRVQQTGGAPGNDGSLWPVWGLVPQLPEEAMTYEYETEDVFQYEGENSFPRPEQLPPEWPTVQGAFDRWSWYARLPEDQPANAWGHSVRCWTGGCDEEVRIDVQAGRRFSDTRMVAVTPDLQPRAFGMDWTYSQLGFDSTGLASWFTQMDLDYDGAKVVAPTGPPAASAPREDDGPSTLLATFVPTVPQAAGATVLGLILGALYWLWPKLKAGAALGLFSRISGQDLLEHPARAQLLMIVQAEPGVHFQDLVRRSGLPNGTAVHHLGKLTKGGLVSVRALGRYTCYFPGASPSRSAVASAAVLRSDGARRVYEAIQGHPGLSGLELAGLVGLQPSTVNYHVQKLVESGLVLSSREGRALRLSPAAAS
jgi:predicted transcriptional regulator